MIAARRPAVIEMSREGPHAVAHIHETDRRPAMIIHPSTVELAPNEVRLLEDNGLTLSRPHGADWTPVARQEFAQRLTLIRASSVDPDSQAVLSSFLRQLRA
jgi:hypothetical protein